MVRGLGSLADAALTTARIGSKLRTAYSSRRAHARSEKLAQLRTEADANLERAEKAEASAKVR